MVALARIMNTFHIQFDPVFHGHLSSHNIFIEYPSNEDAAEMEWTDLQQAVKVKVGQAELKDLAKYANMFYDYRVVSIWSAPECLK